jgi:hypothetical protein
VTKGAAGWRAARRRTSRRSTSSKACHRAGLWRKLVSSSIGIIDEIRFVVRSLGTISAICQRARRRHRRSARLVCGTGPRRQAAHGSHSSRVVSRIRGAGCRARPHRASEARRRGRSRSRAAHEGSDARCKGARQEVRKCGSAALGETTSPSCPNVVRLPVPTPTSDASVAKKPCRRPVADTDRLILSVAPTRPMEPQVSLSVGTQPLPYPCRPRLPSPTPS